MADKTILFQELIETTSDVDLLCEMIGLAADRPMAHDVEALCRAGHGERSAERVNQRNGYRERLRQTRAGAVALQVLGPQAVIITERPGLEIGEDPVDPGQDDMGGHRADDVGIVGEFGGAVVAWPAVGLGAGSRGATNPHSASIPRAYARHRSRQFFVIIAGGHSYRILHKIQQSS